MDEKSSLIYKINEHALLDSAQPQERILSEAQEDVIAYALSEVRHQLRTEFKAAHGRIDKQLNDELAKLSAEIGQLRAELQIMHAAKKGKEACDAAAE